MVSPNVIVHEKQQGLPQMKKTMRNIKSGDKVITGYRDNFDDEPCTFIGFTDTKDKYGDDLCADKMEPFAESLSDLKKKTGFKNAIELEQVSNGLEYGFKYYAVFEEADGTRWCAYLFNGYWAVGSSADRLQFGE